MAIEVYEKFGSRESTAGESPSIDLLFFIKGTDDDLEAKHALADATPIFYDGLKRQSIHVTQVGDDLWDGSARYGKIEKDNSSIYGFSFDTTGGTRRVTQSIATVGSYAPDGETPPNFHGAIGVTRDNVEGVDAPAESLKFSFKRAFPAGSIDMIAYSAFLSEMTGRVNESEFLGHPAGSVRFLGATGSEEVGSDEDSEITYNFEKSDNATDIDAGAFTIASKKGWEYVWFRYEDDVDETANAIVKKPIAAYVEQVSHYADLNSLLP